MKKITEEVKKQASKLKENVKKGFNTLQGKWKRKKKSEASSEEKKDDAPQIDVSKITYRKERRGLPKLFVSSRKGKLKRGVLIGIPIFMVAIGGVLGYLEANKNTPINSEVVLVTHQNYHRVYLLSNDDYVVPISVARTPKYTLAEEILDVFEYLKVGVKDVNRYLRGYLPSATKINNIDLTDNVLTLDFSEDFVNYEAKNELQILQSLVFTYLEFAGVDSFQFMIEGTLVKTMPRLMTPVFARLDRGLGINISAVSAQEALSKEKAVVYYTRTYDADNTFYIPVSVYANKGQTIAKTFYNALDYNPGVISGLRKVDLYSHIDREVDPLLTDEAIIIDLKDTALLDEGTIQKDIFDLLVLNFYLANISQRVNLQVNGETYRVNGYQDSDSVPVSSIISTSVAV